MTLPPPVLVSQRWRTAAGPPLALASDLPVPLAEVRMHTPGDGGPDRGIPCRLDLALITRERQPSDPPAAEADGRPGVGAAVLVRPCLHTQVDMAALLAGHTAFVAAGQVTALERVLLPRGRSARPGHDPDEPRTHAARAPCSSNHAR